MSPPSQKIPKRPSIRPEREFAAQCGGALVAGIDEAGRGPIAGPVVAAAVVFSFDKPRPVGLRDSKKLTERARERLYRQIRRQALTCGIGIATAQEIDLINILEATRLAALRAVSQLDPQPGALITDALTFTADPRPQLPLIKGDAKSSSIAAASILAKVTRDRLMTHYHRQFPEFGWASNRGYPTEEHYAAIAEHGPTVLHRLSFSGVGFFTVEPRRSPLYHDLLARLDALIGRGENHSAVLRPMVEENREILPPPDYDKLLRHLDEAPAIQPAPQEPPP